MYVIGVDIGTTTICAVLMDMADGRQTAKNITPNQFIFSEDPNERIQDPERIREIVKGQIDELIDKYQDIGAIGITGQMHGILYIDKKKKALSPLYTWQDKGKSALEINGRELPDYVDERYGCSIDTGWGLATHLGFLKDGSVPEGADKIVTIEDYVITSLTKADVDTIHVSNAAGLGFFDTEALDFKYDAIEDMGIDPAILPRVEKEVIVPGTYRNIPVVISVGDNQAGYAGAVKDPGTTVLVNVGTSAQVSLLTDKYCRISHSIDVRPYFEGKYLLAGSSLCGGSAYAILEKFFRSYMKAAGFGDSPQFDTMEAIISDTDNNSAGEKIKVSTLFEGTRDRPEERGRIENIRAGNFTPYHLIYGFMEGVIRELYDMYQIMTEESGIRSCEAVISGNGVKKSRVMQSIVREYFKLPVKKSRSDEDAAAGAALIAAVYTGKLKNMEEARRLINYEES